MRISSVRIKNYKSISDSEVIEMKNLFTVIAGKNNVGKTAVLEAIYKCFQGNLRTPTISMGANGNKNETVWQEEPVEIEFSIDITQDEIKKNVSLLRKAIQTENIIATFQSNKGITIFTGLYDFSGNYKNPIFVWEQDSGNPPVYRPDLNEDDGLSQLFNFIKSSIIFISGRRTLVDQQSVGTKSSLNIAASDLYAVMHALHNNLEKEIFDPIETMFLRIFPDVKQIRTPVGEGSSTSVHLDFGNGLNSVPLHECGSGLTHVLIMLCAIINLDSKIILFDEPHTFLHPSAEKAIYDIAANHKKNQYIFTTHSPILINYRIDKNMYLTSKEQMISRFRKLDDINAAFEEIGISANDFPLADKILFVEGSTEELILPHILSHSGVEQFGYNYIIINMEGCNNLVGKPSMNHHIFEKIFSKVSAGFISYKVIIDKDEKNEQELEKIKSAFGDKIIILDRREMENYFLVPSAIKECLNECLLRETHASVTDEEIETLLENYFQQTHNKALFPKKSDYPTEQIKGSEVLKLIFERYGISYRKKMHGEKLALSILKSGKSEELCKLGKNVANFIKN